MTAAIPPELERRVLQQIEGLVDSDPRRAFDLANLALSKGMIHPTLFRTRSYWLWKTGQPQDALKELDRASRLAPLDPSIPELIGSLLLELGNLEGALGAFNAAIALAPTQAHLHFKQGDVLSRMGSADSAYAAFSHAIELDPIHTDALAAMASIAARKADAETAFNLAQRALARQPGHPTATVALIVLDLAQKQFARAEARIRALLNGSNLELQPRTFALGMLGDSLDGQKRYAEAFDAYALANRELRDRASTIAGNRGLDAAGNLTTFFEAADAGQWAPKEKSRGHGATVRGHIFLLGFMRSGTTLLEQVLATNPQIVALEEKSLLHSMGDTYMTSVPALESLAKIDEETRSRQCDLYWHRVRESAGDISGKIFLDKQPLNTARLPIISKLFPNAKILFALRDPRDVVFSCFRRLFRLNATMYEFLDLIDAAKFYSAIMRLAQIYREKLPLDLFELRYEDMVTDFDHAIREICNFTGLEWQETMRNFHRGAQNVDIRSPSATQVRRPLYGEGAGHWRNYKTQLAPIFPILQPWVERFGYPES